MYCMKCGKEMPDDSKFCLNCGAPVGEEEPAANDSQAVSEPAPAAAMTPPVQPAPSVQPVQPIQHQPIQQQPMQQVPPQQYAAASPNQNLSMPYGPNASGMAPGFMGMVPDFTPEEIALLQKGWTLCKLAFFVPIGFALVHQALPLPNLQRFVTLAAAIMLCVDKSYLSRCGLPMSAWYYLAIFLCPPVYLYHRENLTGHSHTLSIIYGVLYVLGILLIFAVIGHLRGGI